MRTTLTLDPEVATLVKREVRRTGKSLKAVVNEGLRRGLCTSDRVRPLERYVPKAYDMGVRPGIDLDKANQLLDEWDIEDYLEKQRRDRS